MSTMPDAREDRTSEVLAFVARHELVVAAQAERFLSMPTDVLAASLNGLIGDGLVSRVRVIEGMPPLFRATPAGQDRVDPSLPELSALDVSTVRRHLAAGWLWVAGKEGALLEQHGVLSQREMLAAWRSTPEASKESLPFPMVLAPDGETVFPDVTLFAVAPVVIHVALSGREPDWWSRLFAAYQDAAEVGAVLVVAETSERRIRLSDLAKEAGATKVYVRQLAPGGIAVEDGYAI